MVTLFKYHLNKLVVYSNYRAYRRTKAKVSKGYNVACSKIGIYGHHCGRCSEPAIDMMEAIRV